MAKRVEAQEAIDRVASWFTDAGFPQTFLLTGGPGVGKTGIAMGVANALAPARVWMLDANEVTDAMRKELAEARLVIVDEIPAGRSVAPIGIRTLFLADPGAFPGRRPDLVLGEP